jgi:hypothetical protein
VGIGNLQTSTKILAHGDRVNEGTVRTRSLHTSTFIGSVLTQGIAGREVLAESGTTGAAAPGAQTVRRVFTAILPDAARDLRVRWQRCTTVISRFGSTS